MLLIQAAIPHMRARGGGSVVNIGSVNAYIGEPKLCPYSVSKGGLMTLTKNAAATLNRDRIRVNQINVGWTLTEGEHKVKLLEGKGEDWLVEAVATRPWGRLLSPDDVANAVEYFATDKSALVTGAVHGSRAVSRGSAAELVEAQCRRNCKFRPTYGAESDVGLRLIASFVPCVHCAFD